MYFFLKRERFREIFRDVKRTRRKTRIKMSKRQREERSKGGEKKMKEDPESAVIRAIEENDMNLARFLLFSFVPYQVSSFTSLHLAAMAGFGNCIKVLIRNGADVNARARARMYTPLHMAVKRGYASVVDVLIDD